MSEFKALYSSLMEKSGLPQDELEKRLNEKIEGLGHLVNEEVALRLVARDLGIALFNDEAKRPVILIADIVPNMNNVNLELLVEAMDSPHEFVKKDGSMGSLLRAIVSDESGKGTLIAWDDQVELLSAIKVGSKIIARSAYTKSGLRGDVEIHLGRRSRLDILGSPLAGHTPQAARVTLKGRIWRTSETIFFTRKDGSQGTLVSFQLKTDRDIFRVLLWNPISNIKSELVEGVLVEILGSTKKTDMNGKIEIHVNNAEDLIIYHDDLIEVKKELTSLSDIRPDMEGFNVEGVIELDPDIETTYSGKTYIKTLIRSGETVLPVILWNDKAIEFKGSTRKGSTILLEDCYSKLGPRGLELGISRWGRVIIKK